MKPKHDPKSDIATWIASATSLTATYFRSVDHERIDKVLSGELTRKHGGRFAPVGTNAIFFAVSDSGATTEVTARKDRLGGASQMPLDHYPRIIFAVSIHLDRVLDLRKLQSNPNLKQTCENCRTPDTGHSQQFAVPLIQAGIQGLFFPSVHAGGDLNLVVYLDNLDNGNTIQIVNEESFRENAKRLILPKP